MVYLIIFCALALIIGSWMWVMPTPREKAVAGLRQKAIMAGFNPKFVSWETYCTILGNHWQKLQHKPDVQIVRYGWRGKIAVHKLVDKHLLCLFSAEGQLVASENRLTGNNVSDEFKLFAQAFAREIQGLMLIELIDLNNERSFNFYWLEQGSIARFDFKSHLIEQAKSDSFQK